MLFQYGPVKVNSKIFFNLKAFFKYLFFKFNKIALAPNLFFSLPNYLSRKGKTLTVVVVRDIIQRLFHISARW